MPLAKLRTILESGERDRKIAALY
jgi:hypothetical protein